MKTYKQLKSKLATVAGELGMDPDDVRVKQYVNDAIEHLWPDANIPGIVDQYLFRVYDRTFTLPTSLEQVEAIDVAGEHYATRSPWFEFSASGGGYNSPTNEWVDNIVIDRGYSPTAFPIPSPSTTDYSLYIVGEKDERVSGVRPKVTIKFFQPDGTWTRTYQTLDDGTSDWQDGEQLEINGDTSPYTSTAVNSCKSIDEIIKEDVTNGGFSLYCSDGTTDTFLGHYASRDKGSIEFRKYYIADVTVGSATEVLARVRRKFTPIVEDNDRMFIDDPNILIPMIQALNHRDNGDPDNYVKYARIADYRLAKLVKRYMGQPVDGPVMQTSETFGTMGGMMDLH